MEKLCNLGLRLTLIREEMRLAKPLIRSGQALNVQGFSRSIADCFKPPFEA
ncbi:MAG: hypothetical protein H7237_12300 [Alkalinema sp. FL-bin-369]|nr:hypothetical protein [Leptolyngbyaceae cyanobacterium LF-bin-369]